MSLLGVKGLRDEKREEYYEHKSYLENREYSTGAQNVKVCHQGQQFADRYFLYFLNPKPLSFGIFLHMCKKNLGPEP